jgi:hypothetical protein
VAQEHASLVVVERPDGFYAFSADGATLISGPHPTAACAGLVVAEPVLPVAPDPQTILNVTLELLAVHLTRLRERQRDTFDAPIVGDLTAVARTMDSIVRTRVELADLVKKAVRAMTFERRAELMVEWFVALPDLQARELLTKMQAAKRGTP